MVNKRAGEAAEGAAPGMVSLPEVLGKTFGTGQNAGGNPFLPTAVHRIDVPVSGCILFARTPPALTFLNTAFSRRQAVKTYWAVIEQNEKIRTIPESGELRHWIAVDGRRNKSFAFSGPGENRKEAVLRYRVAGAGDRYCFMEIDLTTGRHHQIRAQLAAEGLFIKGDLKYGARRSERNGGIRLHARFLSFPSPDRPDQYISVTAEPPLPDRLWEACMQSMV
ncbi:RNA pseudouridine synthase [Breznakiella homolactica]|uniref:RNA pseudouridine synthase n=1 Tax=Breznakiella homolactica TaxID=2798577 RepID=A0A7T7XRY2_9SPIR|nr:RNA pseudouridine synthase [Breznakiella homolactica]